MLNGHGDDSYRYNIELKANFSSNVWYKGAAPELTSYLQNKIGELQSYPAPNSEDLVVKIADHYGLEKNNVLVSNGATEAFYLIAHAFKNKSATIFYPTFSEYEDACFTHEIKLKYLSREELNNCSIQTELAFICNPNNPDGKLNSELEVKQILQKHPNTVFVIDEAYIEFTIEQQESSIKLLSKYQNLIIVKSLTKLFAIPGLRLGFILCSEQLQQRIIKNKMPWNVNQMAIEAGKFIYDNFDKILPDLNDTNQLSKKLQEQINDLAGMEVLPSQTNYFLVKLNQPKASELKEYLAYQHRLLIRDASNFHGLNQHYFRICPQNKQQNELLLNALSQWISQYQ